MEKRPKFLQSSNPVSVATQISTDQYMSCQQIARVFERLFYDQFYTYLVNHNLLNRRQSGFRSLHSTVTVPLDLTNEWCLNQGC